MNPKQMDEKVLLFDSRDLVGNIRDAIDEH